MYIFWLTNPQIAQILKKLVIAIDGPAASGKSSTSRLVAKRLGYLYIDTGAMYRAVTLKVLREKIDPADSDAVGSLAERSAVCLEQSGDDLAVILDGEDVSGMIRTREVTAAVSAVSAIEKVRTVMVREQRKLGRRGGVVMDGRDIGTVVFPDADLKIYMIADVSVRALRRQKDLKQAGTFVDHQTLIEEIVVRDRKDSGRAVSPLRKAEDAVALDTTGMTIDEQVEYIVKIAFRMLGIDESSHR